jgi:hypothetical protein
MWFRDMGCYKILRTKEDGLLGMEVGTMELGVAPST